MLEYLSPPQAKTVWKRLYRVLLMTGSLLLASVVGAQDLRTAYLFMNFDVTDTSFIYCRFDGQGGTPFGAAIQGPGRAVTVGSSITVTEFVIGSNPFAPIVAGDMMLFTLAQPAVPVYRLVTAKASNASITVNGVIDLTGGFSWTYYKRSCGTGAESGWVGVTPDSGKKLFSYTITTIAATSIESQVQCREDLLNQLPQAIYPPAGGTGACGTGSATAAVSCSVGDVWPWSQCRFGFKVTGDAGVQNISAKYIGRGTK